MGKPQNPPSPCAAASAPWSLLLLAPLRGTHSAMVESRQCPGAFEIPVSGGAVNCTLMCNGGRGGGEGIKQHAWSGRGLRCRQLRCRQLNPAPHLHWGAAGAGLGALPGCPTVVPAPRGWALPGQGWRQGWHGCGSAGLRLGCCLARLGFCVCGSDLSWESSNMKALRCWKHLCGSNSIGGAGNHRMVVWHAVVFS